MTSRDPFTAFVYGRPVHVGYTRGVESAAPYVLGRHFYPHTVQTGFTRGVIGDIPYTLGGYHKARVAGIVVTADEVQARKVALDAGWSQLALDITLSTVLALAPTAPDGMAFDADLAAWKVFLQEEANSLNAGTQDDTTSLWQTKLVTWQTKAKSMGVTTHGIPVPLPPAPPSVGSLLWPVVIGAGLIAAGQIFGGAFRKGGG
jgi:hypothetical protein